MSTCPCNLPGPDNGHSCSGARSESVLTLDGRPALKAIPCPCGCHWREHREDCAGWEDCICQRSPREMVFELVPIRDECSLTEVLREFGFGHAPCLDGSGRQVVFCRRDRSTVLVGNSAAVWAWLRERGLIGEDR